MSGFELLVNLVPLARHAEIAVIVLTRLALYPMLALPMSNDVQAYMLKAHLSGDNLDWAIQKAIFAVAFKKAHHS